MPCLYASLDLYYLEVIQQLGVCYVISQLHID